VNLETYFNFWHSLIGIKNSKRRLLLSFYLPTKKYLGQRRNNWMKYRIVSLLVVGVMILGFAGLSLAEEYYASPYGTDVTLPPEFDDSIKVIFTDRLGIPHPAVIYLPRHFDPSKKYPAIVCTGGWMGSLEMYNIMAKMLAYHDYIAMQIHPTLETTLISSMVLSAVTLKWVHDVQDAITYLIERSPVKQWVDPGRIGVEGHSMGGFTVSRVAVLDDRVKAVVALSNGTIIAGPFKKCPVMVITGDFDIIINDQLFAYPYYYACTPPKELIVIKGGTHDGFSNLVDPFYPKPPWQHWTWEYYATAWFDYWLKGDQSALKKLTNTLYTPYGVECLSAVHNSVYNFGDGDHVIAGPGKLDPYYAVAQALGGLGLSSLFALP